jgi:hypothetical protein
MPLRLANKQIDLARRAQAQARKSLEAIAGFQSGVMIWLGLPVTPNRVL